jgi:hypothetical protein
MYRMVVSLKDFLSLPRVSQSADLKVAKPGHRHAQLRQERTLVLKFGRRRLIPLVASGEGMRDTGAGHSNS